MLSHRQYIILIPAADCKILIKDSMPHKGFLSVHYFIKTSFAAENDKLTGIQHSEQLQVIYQRIK